MEALAIIGYIAGGFGLISVVAASVVIVKSTTAKTTIAQQNELIVVLTQSKNEQKEQIGVLQGQHAEAMKAIANMQGQIDILKNIPLVNIDTTLKAIATFNENLAASNAQIVDTNNKILESLTSSASTLAKNTADVADAVEHVKSDLKSK